jgi:hypothetical protein
MSTLGQTFGGDEEETGDTLLRVGGSKRINRALLADHWVGHDTQKFFMQDRPLLRSVHQTVVWQKAERRVLQRYHGGGMHTSGISLQAQNVTAQVDTDDLSFAVASGCERFGWAGAKSEEAKRGELTVKSTSFFVRRSCSESSRWVYKRRTLVPLGKQ